MRILFAQPSLQPPGGGNAVAAWMAQALEAEHEVTLLTWSALDLGAVDRFNGTRLAAGRFRTLRVPGAWRWPVEPVPVPAHLLRTALLLRAARRHAAAHDLVVSANNESDFGRPGVQYVHYPWNVFTPAVQHLRWYHPRALVRLYAALCRAVSRFSPEGMRTNVTLVNSDWTGRVVQRRYGVPTRTVHPPVATGFAAVPWEAREPGFVCIGRIAPEKALDRVLDVVAAVRREVPAVRLHLVGTPEHRAYYGHIARRARAEDVTLHHDLSRADLVALMTRQRYGLHGMPEEHFGMAVAEMVAAGCIVWAPDSGGPVEILGDARLTYGSLEEAVAKILRVLRSPAEQAALRAHLAARVPRFSPERFVREIRAVVAGAATSGASAPAAAPGA
jgi:glycosyltransferase involved in cell wall biosynthesis